MIGNKEGNGSDIMVIDNEEASNNIKEEDQKDSDEAAEISQQANLVRDLAKKENQEPDDEPVNIIDEPAPEDIQDPENMPDVKHDEELQANRYMLLDKLFLFVSDE